MNLFHIVRKKEKKTSNNKIIFVTDDGTETIVESVKGLDCKFIGDNNILKIHKDSFFDQGSCVWFHGSNSYVEFGKIYVHAFINVAIGHNGRLLVGDNFSSNGSEFNLIEDGSYVKIGNDVLFAKGTKIFSSDMHTIYEISEGKILNYKNQIILHDHIWIAEDAMILGNSEVLSDSVIGAKSVVNKRFAEKNIILAGTPAKIVKKNINWNRSFPSELVRLSQERNIIND